MNGRSWRSLVTLLCLLVFLAPARADEPKLLPPPEPGWLTPKPEKRYWQTNLFKRIATDQIFLARTWWPGEARRLELSVPMLVVLAGASGSSTGGLDLQIQRELSGWTTGGRRDLAGGITRLGNKETAVLLLGGSYLISRWSGNERMRRATSLSSEALVNAAVYTTVLKRLSRRTRPSFAGTGEFFVDRPLTGQETTSFPSGHASGAFAVATVFASVYRDRRWVPWVAYTSAGLVALSRVALDRHFPSDVMAGAALGQSMGRAVMVRDSGEPGRPVTRFEPLFEPSNNGFGVAYSRSW